MGGPFVYAGASTPPPTVAIDSVADQADLTPVALSASVTVTGTPTYAWTAHGPDGTAGSFDDATSATPTFTPTARGEWTIILAVTDDGGTTTDTEVARFGWRGWRTLSASDAAATLNGSYTPTISTTAGQTTVSVAAASKATVVAHFSVKIIDMGLTFSQLAGKVISFRISAISGVTGDALGIMGITDSLVAVTNNDSLVGQFAIGGVATTHAAARVADGGVISMSTSNINVVRLQSMYACTVEADTTGGPAGGVSFQIRSGLNPFQTGVTGTRNLYTGANRVYAFIGGGSNNTSAASFTATFEILIE